MPLFTPPGAISGALTASGGAAITGDVAVNSGNLLVNTAGKGIRIKEGSNACMGTATLVAGAATVATTAVTANSRIFLSTQTEGGTPGFLGVSARVAATSFTIAGIATDTSVIAWILIEPA